MGYTECEHWCRREDKNIYGKLFLPDGWQERPHATAIFSHGLSTNHGDMEPYARTAAERGMVTYVFDFCGGGNYSQSDWQDNMSLFTEQHDLESVAWELAREPFTDEHNLFLCGASLGATCCCSMAMRTRPCRYVTRSERPSSSQAASFA
ncbi:prolyl oligopeptidase family serine peptidase [Parafannyhessea umbonata]|jgi:alpha-beta hydrolase superfamily lysophospholipase|uniref:prolyl oligopeptidase family serine peptidase n=1 Tax=Parafannyhessea umbonata TaxID=604330 RepID=UPI001E469762|nr:prolyl oligopeptidase family serine peptidase [Parafannyhessea umbonata]